MRGQVRGRGMEIRSLVVYFGDAIIGGAIGSPRVFVFMFGYRVAVMRSLVTWLVIGSVIVVSL